MNNEKFVAQPLSAGFSTMRLRVHLRRNCSSLDAWLCRRQKKMKARTKKTRAERFQAT